MSTPNLLATLREFAEWHQRLAGLRTFWTGRILEYHIQNNPDRYIVYWKKRSCKKAVFYTSLQHDALDDPETCHYIITRKHLDPRTYDRWSIIFIYNTNGKTLEPNPKVEIRIYEDPDRQSLVNVEKIQRASWGFYVPPRKGSIVFLAWLAGEVVGSAYFHVASRNVDYGIHVVREYWRMRVGTSLLNAVAGYARGLGLEWFSIVRVLRGRRPTSSDRRAMGFYEANGPVERFYVYRLLT